MTFIQSIKFCLSHYANFEGRATRSEFWWFFLFCKCCSYLINWFILFHQWIFF